MIRSTSAKNRRGSIALALLIVMMLLIGMALTGLARDATHLRQRESDQVTTLRLENAVATIGPLVGSVELPIRLPISTSPPHWVEVSRLPDSGEQIRLRAVEVRDGRETVSITRTLAEK